MRVALALVVAALSAAPVRAAEPRVLFSSDIDGPERVPAACAPLDSESWPILAADPDHPERLRGVAQVGGVRASVGIVSDTGGRIWRTTPLPATSCAGGPAHRSFSVNPQAAAGPRGTAWYGQSWVNGSPFAFSVDVLRRRGNGAWRPVAAPGGDQPAQNLAIVPHPADPARAVAVWTQLDQPPAAPTYAPAGSRVLAARTEDSGRTWSAPVVAVEPGVERYAIDARAVRASDGAVVVVVDRLRKEALATAIAGGGPSGLTPDAGDIVSVRSEDGGRTWSAPVPVGPIEFVTVVDPDHDGVTAPATTAVSVKPDLAAGPDGLLAVSAPLEPVAGISSVMLATSRNGGRSWMATRQTVRVAAPLIQPAVAVDRRGRIGLQWYDFRADEPRDATWDLQPRVAVLRRDGTWAETALSPPFDLHATNACSSATPVADPVTTACELDVDAMAIGVYPDLVGLADGFGAGYTVGPPLAEDGFTDARFSRVAIESARGTARRARGCRASCRRSPRRGLWRMSRGPRGPVTRTLARP